MSGHYPWPDARCTASCLVRCNCHGVRLMTLNEMREHMAEAHPVLFEGLHGKDGE